MLHTRTLRYALYVAGLEERRSSLCAEVDRLAAMAPKARKPAQRARLRNARNQVRTLDRRIARAADASSLCWVDAFHALAELNGGLWTPAELDLLKQEVTTFEGRGEKPLRHRFGLPLEATLESHDLFNDEEVKYVGALVEPFKVGRMGRQAYVRSFKELVRELPDEALPPEAWDDLANGEVSAGKLHGSMPQRVRDKLRTSLAPDRVLACYSALYLTTPEGFVRVPRDDFAAALGLVSVTQMGPKYRLRREYVDARLRSITPAAPA